jgi:hypothetical protein
VSNATWTLADPVSEPCALYFSIVDAFSKAMMYILGHNQALSAEFVEAEEFTRR